MNMTPEAVTFDFHNTLATCDEWFQIEIRGLLPAFLSWYVDNVDACDVEIDPEEAVAIYRRIRMEIMEHGMEVDAVSSVDAVLGEMNVSIDHDTIERGVRQVMCATLPDSQPVQGVVNAVRTLKQLGVRLGVVSSAAYHPFLEWSLQKFGILHEFDTVVTSARCGFYKSRPEIYSIAMEELNARPERSVHVGDSHRFDVETASKIDMLTVWYNHDGVEIIDHKAHAVVTTLENVDRSIIDLYRGRAS
jgi:FMN phosphatase YigB (HAD superfamily)